MTPWVPANSLQSRIALFVSTSAAMATIVSIRTLIVMTFGLGLCCAIIFEATAFVSLQHVGVQYVITIAMAAIVICSLGGAACLARREHAVAPRFFVPLALVVALMIRIGYLLAADPAWVGDFARYWQKAVNIAYSNSYVASDVYSQRALPYLVPLVELFGPSHLALKLCNIGLLCLVQLIGYDTIRRASDHRAAQAFTLVWIGAPEPLFAALIPSHDLAGLALTTVIVWLAQLAAGTTHGGERRLPLGLVYSVLLALTLCLLQLQRGTGTLLLGVIVVTGIACVLIKQRFPGAISEDKGLINRLCLVAILCIPVYGSFTHAAREAGFVVPKPLETYAVMRYTTPHAISLSDGTYTWMRSFHDAFSSAYALDISRFSDFRTSLVLSDYAESPVQRARNMLQRIDKQYRLGASSGHYWTGIGEKSPRLPYAVRVYTVLFSFAFALFSLFGLSRLLARPSSDIVSIIILLTISASTLGLVLAAENQARYLFVVWYAGAAVIALGLERTRPESLTHTSRSGLGALAALALSLGQALLTTMFAMALVWAAIVLFYPAGAGRIISGWRSDGDARSEATTSNNARKFTPDDFESDVLVDASNARRGSPKRFGALALSLELPGPLKTTSKAEAAAQVCFNDTQHTALEFFVYTPYKNLERRGAFELTLATNGVERWRLDLPDSIRSELVQIPNAVVAGRCNDLKFTLRSKISIESASWRRASRVEIFFPRLVVPRHSSSGL